MRHLLLSALILALQAAPALAEDFSAREFFRHRAAAADALKRNDPVAAQAEIAAARSLLPSAPSVLLMGARIALSAQKPEAAKTWLNDYIARGLWFDPARQPDLAALLSPAERARLDANGTDFGAFTTVAQLDTLRLAEGVTMVGDRVYYTTIHDGALNAVGQAKPVHALAEGRGAYGVAAKGSSIWIAASPDQAAAASTTAYPSELVRIDTASSSAPETFTGGAGSRFGDIALGAHAVYVSDGGAGAVLRLDPQTGAWQTLIAAGRLPSPQGLAENADGTALIVADYTSGLYRVDLAGGDILQLPVPETASLIGVDGVARFGNDLIVIQNGIEPGRLLRIGMSNDWKAIESVQILLRGGALDEPTNGVVSGDRYLFVARSQWSDFDGDGQPKATHGPAIIGEIRLTD
ncbi:MULTISPECIES: hypothetical protein [Asticcacaulis]|uniref:hypothetical protein n=1 Tax=Asticcacaulis TaxID=76890 RepID=UPI001AEB3B53|nr:MULTISPECIES: hypothetical protein [Asticcacaulis]MBP2158206.1 hypothetical protein [Asticcacaulis solisilvae]MDR6799251.1 hypothetical protein [Asticcacaulis sp. BE141]